MIMQREQDRWLVLKVFVRIKELDVVSKRQQEEEGEEIKLRYIFILAQQELGYVEYVKIVI